MLTRHKKGNAKRWFTVTEDSDGPLPRISAIHTAEPTTLHGGSELMNTSSPGHGKRTGMREVAGCHKG